jgi:acyl carrier protein
LGPSGKLDQAALPRPEESDLGGHREYVAPQGELGNALAAIFAELLGVERVGADDDFFELGGHSLLATQVVARARSTFGVPLEVHALFTAPTVAALAEVIRSRQTPTEEDPELAALLLELEDLSDEEAEQLLAAEQGDGADAGS